MNWNRLKVILKLYELGTIRAAAKVLDVDQATIGRYLNEIETELNMKLFVRSRNGVKPTADMLGILPYINTIQDQIYALDRVVYQSKEQVTGIVKISTTDSLAVDFIAPMLITLKEKYPHLKVELITTIDTLSLDKSEVDISIRTYRATESEFIVRHLASWEVGLYASEKYLLDHGMPNTIHNQSIVAYQEGITNNLDINTVVGESIQVSQVICRANSSLILANLVHLGIGMGELPTYIADKQKLIRIWPEKKRKNDYEVWLAMYKDTYKTPRVRVVVNEIVKIFENEII